MPLIPVDLPTAHVAGIAAARPGSPRCVAAAMAGEAPPLHEAILARRAVRRFAADPVDQVTADLVVNTGLTAFRQYWWGEPLVLVAAFAVGGRPAGLYQGERSQGQPDWLPQLRQAYASAPMLILICDDVVSRQPGHAASLVHAGAAGYGMWLAATRCGLAACAYGGSNADVTAAAERARPLARHLFTLAIGHSPQEREETEEF